MLWNVQDTCYTRNDYKRSFPFLTKGRLILQKNQKKNKNTTFPAAGNVFTSKNADTVSPYRNLHWSYVFLYHATPRCFPYPLKGTSRYHGNDYTSEGGRVERNPGYAAAYALYCPSCFPRKFISAFWPIRTQRRSGVKSLDRIAQVPVYVFIFQISATVSKSNGLVWCPARHAFFWGRREKACVLRTCDTAVFAVFYPVSVKPFKCIWEEPDRLSAICGRKLNLGTFGVDLCLYRRLKWLSFDDFSGCCWPLMAL